MENENDAGSAISPSASVNPSGGLAFGGDFGADTLAPSTAALIYLSRINPNLMGLGILLVVALFGINAIVSSLGKANPNNALLETQQIQASAYKDSLAATAELATTVAKNKGGCAALVCFYSEPAAAATAEPQPSQPPQWQPPQAPEYYAPIAPDAQTVQLVASNPDFWRYQWQRDPGYVQTWIASCQAQGGNYGGWQSPECLALIQAMN